MPSVLSGARPIQLSLIQQHYLTYTYKKITLSEYTQCWKDWLNGSKDKFLHGLHNFIYGEYTQGTSQTFDHFVLRHSATKKIVTFIGDFQYHACISKHQNFTNISNINQLTSGQALIISLPFSDTGKSHESMEAILHRCNDAGIPVCLDLSYWGISKNISLDLNKYFCIKEITSSLSKPFYKLENHRVGIRFSRDYLDDGISMLNEVKMQNFSSMGLGLHFMRSFDADWNWRHNGTKYQSLCKRLGLSPTDVIIFGTSDNDKYKTFNRGIPGHHRVCISDFLKDITDDS